MNMILNTMHKKRLHIIRIFTLLLLLVAGGTANEAWAQVTYHVLTRPITTKQRPQSGSHDIDVAVNSDLTTFRTNVRVEALRCTSDETTVGLPDKYKSPLAKNFKYYAATTTGEAGKVTKNALTQLYGYIDTQYYTYTINGTVNNADLPDDDSKLLAPGSTIPDGTTDIYVTCEYDDTQTILDLTGNTLYNIEMDMMTGAKTKRFLVLNKDRSNRPGGMQVSKITDHIDYLYSNEFSYIKDGVASGKNYYHFFFKFIGTDTYDISTNTVGSAEIDPYNITIMTGFKGPDTFKEKDKNLNKDVYKEYKGATIFSLLVNGATSSSNMWLSSDANIQWQTAGTPGNAVGKEVPGYFRGTNNNRNIHSEMSPVFNSFVLLNHTTGTGYALAATKINVNGNDWQPNVSSKNDVYLYNDGDNNVRVDYKASNDADKVLFHEVKQYHFIITTPFGSTVTADTQVSTYETGRTIKTTDIPTSLRRKYCNFIGFYSDAALTDVVSKYSDVPATGNIYVKYEVTGAPFTAIPAANKTTGYTTATWYEITDKDSSTKKIRWDSGTNSFKNNGAVSPNPEREKESEFAFIGDPYELRIINRALTLNYSGNVFVGSSTRTTDSNLTKLEDPGDDTEGAGFKWEIPYDDIAGNFTLREFKSTNAYWQWKTTGSGNEIKYSTSESTRMKVMEIEKVNYTFNVVDLAGNIAIKATVALTPFTPLTGTGVGYSIIPASIRSPFLADETITFYGSYEDRNENGVTNRRDWHDPSELPALTELPDVGGDIYVSYTTTHLSSKNIQLSYSQQFNVQLNGEYIYWNSSNNKILSKKNPTSSELESGAYLWHLRGRDPYCMRIDNVGYSSGLSTIPVDIYYPIGDGTYHSETVNNGQFVQVDGGTWGNDKALTWTSNRDQASRFIAMMSNSVGVYEVLAATGTLDSNSDGNSDIYHIGRASSEGAETRIYDDVTYAHGADELRFELAGTTEVTYHLIDKSGNEIFEGEIKSKNPRLTLPAEFVSPLVEEYYYYPTSAKAAGNAVGDRITEISQDDDNDAADDNHVWVTYTVNNLVEYNIGNKMYRLKFDDGDTFHQEDGHDHMNATAQKAIYPYCNGDCNFFIYGSEQLLEQMGGAASTRTRWAWYIESPNSDPYHVKIVSRQQEPDANKINQRMYFRTYAVNYNDATHVVTGTTTPGVTEIAGTEYVVLGSAHHYLLTTLDKINDGSTNVRRTVNSFEQYWKTWETITNRGSSISGPGVVDHYELAFSETVTLEKRTEVENGLHSYTAWAKSRPIQKASASKRFANETHYYHTVNMGTGTFDFEEMEIVPVLVLLDQHGWEIMRKPLPTSELDGSREAKLNAIRPYNSPMVDKYKFWTKTTKRSGFHQYTDMNNPVQINDKDYVTDDLTNLPPFDAKNVKDSYGDLQDQYVTYTVKEEYSNSYNSSTSTGSPFLIQQGNYLADNNDGTIRKTVVPDDASGGITKYIIDNIEKLKPDGDKKNEIWYVKPNPNIDIEMGYNDYAHDWTNDYTGIFSNGFDPYNIQIQSVSDDTKYFVTNATGATLDEGEMIGTYSDSEVSLGARKSVSGTGQDNRTLTITNATFMAVQDANGNMQLMPRFDKNKRITDFSSLADPQTNAENDKTGTQTTFLIRPLVYDYHIIDNQGREAMRYKTAGENYPTIPDHFRSPLAMDFTYYKTAPTYDSETKKLTVTDQITGSFAEAGMVENSNTVYVRYLYNESNDNDGQKILQGPWLTMSLGGKDVQASGTVTAGTGEGVGLYTGSKDASQHQWQWKFLQSPCVSTSLYYIAPDPYAVPLSNRLANNDPNPQANPNMMSTGIKVGSTDRFIILSHPSGDYALAAAGTESYTYSFLNGGSMTTPSGTAASIENEASFTTTTNSISDNARVIFTDDITHTYTYHIITNDDSGKRKAASADQNHATAESNGFIPTVPITIQTPLLNNGDYLFYGTATESGGAYTIDTNSQIDNLFGLYADDVYVRYKAYDPDKTLYRVPNVKGDDGAGHVAKGSGSNDAPIGLSGDLPYNIVWYNNNMMTSNGTTISDGGNHVLAGGDEYVWTFDGDDPYAIKIKHKNSGKYAVGDPSLADSPTKTFMLLYKTGYNNGVLAETGNQTYMLKGYGQTTGTSDINQFMIFGLSTHKVIYRLVMANIGQTVSIPYSKKDEHGNWVEGYSPSDGKTNTIKGSTHRDLASGTPAGTTYQLGTNMSLFSPSENVNYCVDAGQISLGDSLMVPTIFRRPNCKYFFYVGGVYSNDACSTQAMSSDATPVTLDSKYKGLQLSHMVSDADLLNTTVFINIEYAFDDGLPTNSGSEFVTNNMGHEWYTFETNGTTSWMAHYTYADAKLSAVAGHDLHYTNDYLWKPEGDPYGFKMYNRYVYKNGGETTKVMNATLSNNENVVMNTNDDGNDVYELLPAVADGYFRVRPLKSASLYVNVDNTGAMKLSSDGIASQWTFGLREEMVNPYFDRAGYVGALTKEVAEANKNKNLIEKQTLVYGNEASNFVSYSSGYYRLHNMPNSSGISTNRYVSGYTHDIEKTAVSGGIPMHFYESKGTSDVTYITLVSGFTSTNATRGEIPVSAVEYDPASILYFKSDNTITTQDLNVSENKMTTSSGTTFTVEDIGGAVVTIRNGAARNTANYLNYNQSSMIYDLKYGTGELADHTKWCMEPAKERSLKVMMNNGGDSHYYTTFYAPFDVTITNAEAEAYVCTAWDTQVIHPTSIGKTIPAGTPAIIRSTASGDVILTLPGTAAASPTSCVFTGEYLEQLLGDGETVYTFGLPITGLTGPAADGTLSGVANMQKETTGVGFHINANPNKEVNPSRSLWTRNNRYVLHNKIYYRATGSGAREESMRGIQFVPVYFGDEVGEEQPGEEGENPSEGVAFQGDGCIYDMMGRKVATRQQVEDGSWRLLRPGIYILNGKKFRH